MTAALSRAGRYIISLFIAPSHKQDEVHETAFIRRRRAFGRNGDGDDEQIASVVLNSQTQVWTEKHRTEVYSGQHQSFNCALKFVSSLERGSMLLALRQLAHPLRSGRLELIL